MPPSSQEVSGCVSFTLPVVHSLILSHATCARTQTQGLRLIGTIARTGHIGTTTAAVNTDITDTGWSHAYHVIVILALFELISVVKLSSE